MSKNILELKCRKRNIYYFYFINIVSINSYVLALSPAAEGPIKVLYMSNGWNLPTLQRFRYLDMNYIQEKG